jgi:hypothetical protein
MRGTTARCSKGWEEEKNVAALRSAALGAGATLRFGGESTPLYSFPA